MEIRRLKFAEMDEAARVHRLAFDERLPWLRGLHTPQEDRDYYRTHVFADGEVWGALEGETLVGVIAFRPGWIDQLYILPAFQGRGAGKALLSVAKAAGGPVHLWTFQKNAGARAFYESQGFTAVDATDGSLNEEREPDVLYYWEG